MFNNSRKYFLFSAMLISFSISGQTSRAIIRAADSLIERGKGAEILGLLKEEEEKAIANKDSAAVARIYDLEGEIYISISDAQIAKELLDKSIKVKRAFYGEGSIHMAESYMLLGQYYNYIMDKKVAYDTTKAARELCWKYKKDWNKINVSMVYREYAYALKVYMETDTIRKHGRVYFDSASGIAKKYLGQNSIYIAQLEHDIGNTYTDDCLFYAKRRKLKEVNLSIVKAKFHYGQSISRNLRKSGTEHNIAMNYFTTGLLYQYAYDHDSTKQVLENLQQGLISLIPSFKDKNIFSSPGFDSSVTDKALVIQILYSKLQYLNECYKRTHDSTLLAPALKLCEIASKYWEQTILTYKSFEINQLLNVYYTLPFNEGIKICYELYANTGDEKYKSEAFGFSEKSRYADLLKGFLMPGSTMKTFINTADIGSLQKYLDKDSSVFIEYFFEDNNLTSGNTYVFTITPRDFYFECLPKTVHSDFSNTFKLFRTSLANIDAKEFQAASNYMYRTFLKPVKTHYKGSKRLIIAPDNELALIPFEALSIDSGSKNDFRGIHYLINDYEISYALSATLLLNRTATANSSGNIIGICPGFIQKTPLPFSKTEMNDLSEKVEGSYFFGPGIYTNNLYDTTGATSILYIASHAESDLTEPLNSKIFLSDSCFVSLHDIYDMKPCPSLVVLSACETGLGKVNAEDGVMNFGRAFSYAGATSTITTLWQVDDKASSEVMNRFYRNLFTGMTKREALHDAKLEYLKSANSNDAANPLYWAGMVLTGDRGYVHIKEKKRFNVKWIICAFPLILVFGVYFIRKYRKSN